MPRRSRQPAGHRYVVLHQDPSPFPTSRRKKILITHHQLLTTSLTRRVFTSEHNATDSLHDQRLAAIAAAKATSSPYIDLNQASLAFVDAIGNEAAQAYNLADGDRTHLNEHGSVVFGRMVADLILGHPPSVSADDKWAPAADNCFVNAFNSDKNLTHAIWSGLPA